MASPLTPKIATSLVKDSNGSTAKEIIRDGLDRGIIRGTIAGQIGALVKLYNGRRLPEVERDEQKRPYRYYLRGSAVIQQPPPSTSESIITFRPTLEQEEILTALTETKKCSNRSEAVQWLISAGITSKRAEIHRIVQTYKEIERLRQQVQQTGS